MKIIKLKCTACGANLPVAAPDDTSVICEHCGTPYMIEREQRPKKSEPSSNSQKSTLGPYSHPPISKSFAPKSAQQRKAEERLLRKATIFAVTIAFLTVGGILFAIIGVPKLQSLSSLPISSNEAVAAAERTIPQSEAFRAFVGYIFQKSPESVTADEYASLQYLVIESTGYSFEYVMFTYSFENPMEDEVVPEKYIYPILTFVDVEEVADPFDLQCFKGLKLLDYSGFDDWKLTLKSLPDLQYFSSRYSRSPEDIKNLLAHPEKMKSVSCYFRKLSDIEEFIAAFPELVELEITSVNEELELNSLRKLAELKSLEKITMKAENDMMWLTELTGLKALELEYCNSMDYTFLYSMPNLEWLAMDRTIKLKDISFVANMPRLQHLSLSYGEYSLEPLRNKTSITSLEIESSSIIKGFDAIATLGGLQSLKIDYYNDNEALPDLSGLKYLTYAKLEWELLQAVYNSTSIKTLYVDSGRVNIADLAGMTGLETLILEDISLENPEALHALTALKHLHISRVSLRSFYELTEDGAVDENGNTLHSVPVALFNHPTLEELTLDAVEIYFDITDIGPNETLKKLEINDISIWHNYNPYGADNMEQMFLNLTGLEELAITMSKLSSLEPLQNMHKLRKLNIYDNFISDVSPLTGLDNLRLLICGENPVVNASGLGSKVYCDNN